MIPLIKPYSWAGDVLKLIVACVVTCTPWIILMLMLTGCGGTGNIPISTPYLDEIAAERARAVCMYAGVQVQDMPACIERGVNSRQSTQFLGGWSPIVLRRADPFLAPDQPAFTNRARREEVI
jgi:hypothetical protein